MNNSVYGKTIKEKINAKWNGKETKKLFQKLPFYNTFIKKLN